MSTLKIAGLSFSLVLPLAVAVAGETSTVSPHLGTPMTPAEIAKWDRTIFSDGRGLPPGKGTANEGRALYERKCAKCHGLRGEGATAEELVGEPKPPSRDDPSKSIGSYWPFATTLFDFIYRSMPPAAPGSLSPNETYALTAYLLTANKIISSSDEVSSQTLPKIAMPNRGGFIAIDAQVCPASPSDHACTK